MQMEFTLHGTASPDQLVSVFLVAEPSVPAGASDGLTPLVTISTTEAATAITTADRHFIGRLAADSAAGFAITVTGGPIKMYTFLITSEVEMGVSGGEPDNDRAARGEACGESVVVGETPTSDRQCGDRGDGGSCVSMGSSTAVGGPESGPPLPPPPDARAVDEAFHECDLMGP
jgi:hypothetical protein